MSVCVYVCVCVCLIMLGQSSLEPALISSLSVALVQTMWPCAYCLHTPSLCAARTAEGQRGPGRPRPGEDAQMMSEFGGDPDAQLMDSTRGVIRSWFAG